MKQPTISLAMIVRNEGSRLHECLQDIKDSIDEIVIVDTGSSDNTVEIASEYTDKVYHFTWCDDFSAARNFAIERVHCDWVLSLDADERLDMSEGDLRALIDNPEREAYCLPLHAIQADGNFDRFMVLRLFKNKFRFKGAIHEQIIIDDPTVLGYTLFPILWHSTVSTKERRSRRGRNIALLKKALSADPDNLFLQYYIGTEWLGLGRTDKAISPLRQVLAKLTDQHVLFRSPALRYLISCYKSEGRFNEAICTCLEESMRYPEYSDLFFEAGILFELKGEYEIAVKWFNQAVAAGKPPAVFHHTGGTESYLAYYHIGHCLERSGMSKQAKEFYHCALQANKHYDHPLYQLTILELAQVSADKAYIGLQERGYLTDPVVAARMAELFWESGFPDLAERCLVQFEGKNANMVRLLVRYKTYSGKLAEALKLIEWLRTSEPVLGLEEAVDEIIALLIKQDFSVAKARALELWRIPEARSVALSMLNLINIFRIGKPSCLPELIRARKMTQVLVDILENCWRSKVKDWQMQSMYAALINKIMELLAMSPGTVDMLAAYLKEKSNAVSVNLNHNFEAVRGMCL